MHLIFHQRYIVTVLYLSGTFGAVDIYRIRCPGRSEQRLLSNQCPISIQFHCLLNAADEMYKWECRNREWVTKGNYPVRRGYRQYIDYESCPVDRYQPFLFWSNEDHQCQIVKSLCTEEGQVQYDNGTSTSDKGCRCDQRRGYHFLVSPKNKSFCVSSEEDCSCLQKSKKETHRHNADYQCTSRTLLGTSSYQVLKFPATTDTSFDVPVNETGPNDVVSQKGIREHKTICLVVLVLGGVMVILFSFTYLKACCLSEEKETHNFKPKDDRILTSKENADNHPLDEKENMNLTLIENADNNRFKETENMPSASKENSENHSFMKKDNVLIPSKDNAENSHVMVKDNRSLSFEDNSDNHPLDEKENMNLTSIENADILILHLLEPDQKQEVESFKADLEHLLIEIGKDGIRIKLLEDILSPKQRNSDVGFQTVLTKCNFVFVFISRNFLTSKLKRLRLKESSLKDALGSPELRAQIIIASKCESWQLPNYENIQIKPHDVDLDYLKFVGGSPDYKKVFKDKLNQCFTKD